MTRPLPPHGERARYLRGCRCQPCSQGHYRWMSRWRLDVERGTPRRVPAGPAQDHVAALLAAGWCQASISRASGVAPKSVYETAVRRNPTIARALADRILSVPIGTPPAAGKYVSAAGTCRRVRALMAIGYPAQQLAADLGISIGALSNILNERRPAVLRPTADATAALYRQLALRPGPSRRARVIAQNRGWHGPLAWGDDIDDPAAEPEVDEATPLNTHEVAALRAEEIRHLGEAGVPAHEIAARVGRSVSYVREILTDRRGPGWREQQRQQQYKEAA
ncbi:hypothetical protein [Streptomyces lonarensis]|uniref:Uncharacterized protein n=1 Tax=Streptomyces lonarensis TaxID=700599 RepID=A0A7X6HXE0_9ACTN|nr:hypothetical protein [Streptomyces lonarensis]NJQ04245.1 hypothetical protein [Streptomyces lonarensis]